MGVEVTFILPNGKEVRSEIPKDSQPKTIGAFVGVIFRTGEKNIFPVDELDSENKRYELGSPHESWRKFCEFEEELSQICEDRIIYL
jgi:hypothetical protein